MQFLPSTWQAWGIDAFGQTGTPDIMNPYDAVPSAARMLCADGAAGGGAGLAAAIFDYNHADWYVTGPGVIPPPVRDKKNGFNALTPEIGACAGGPVTPTWGAAFLGPGTLDRGGHAGA